MTHEKKIKAPSEALGEENLVAEISFTPKPKPKRQIVEKKEQPSPVNVSVNVETDSIVEALSTQSAANFSVLSQQLFDKAEKLDVVKLQEAIEIYADELKSKIDSLDIRYYEEEINAVYNNLGEIADAVDSNLEILSKLTGRNTTELRDEFTVMHKELQEKFSEALLRNAQDLKDANRLHEELKAAVDDLPNQQSRFNPQPLLDTLSEIKEEFSNQLDNTHNSLSDDIKNLPEVRYYEKDIQELKEYVDEVNSSIRYYDTDVENLTADITKLHKHLNESFKKKLDQLQKKVKDTEIGIRKDIPTVPEVKYYDEEIAVIREGIHNIQHDLRHLPEVKYYDDDLTELGLRFMGLKEQFDTIEIPDWTETIQSLKEEIGSMKEEQASLLTESEDPIAPQNMEDFVTIEQFQKHYRTFLERVQIQLGTLGGGGAVNILDMDDLDEAVRLNPQDFQGDVLALNYDAATRVTTFVAVPNGGGGPGSVGATGATGPIGATGSPSTVPGPPGGEGATGPSIGAVHAKVGCDGPINVNTGGIQAFTNFNIFNTTSQFDSGGFVFEADGITIPTGQDGIWQVSYAFYFESGVQRGVPLGRLSINGTESGEICATAYIRNQNGNNESSLTFTTLVQLTGGDKVNVLIARGGQSGAVNIQPDPLSSISFMRIA